MAMSLDRLGYPYGFGIFPKFNHDLLLQDVRYGDSLAFQRDVKLIDNKDLIQLSTSDENRYSVLHLAVHSNSLEIIKYLKSNLGDELFKTLAGQEDAHGQTALHWAASDASKLEICRELLEGMNKEHLKVRMHGREQTALHFAVHSGFVDMVKLFTDKLEDRAELFGIGDVYMQTPLHFAAIAGNVDICRQLLQKMAPEQVKSVMLDTKYTALHLAVHSGSFDVVDLFLNHFPIEGIVSMLDKYDQTALHWAASKNQYKMCEELCKKMTAEQIGIKTIDRGQTALHFAAQAGNEGIAEIIINALINGGREDLVKIGDNFGRPAYAWAEQFFTNDVLINRMKPL